MTLYTGTPATLVAGDTSALVTKFNDLRDVAKALSEPWTAYTPTWTGAGGNPVLGNGSFAGSAYMRVGKLIVFRIVLTMGATTTYGTGQWSLTLPVAPINAGRPPFPADLLDTGTAQYAGRLVAAAGSITAQLLADTSAIGGALAAVTSLAPHTWASTDVLTVTGTYEAA